MSLIATFTKQTSKTIRETLMALSADSKVFSAQIQSELPFMSGHEYYVYMQDDEVVFLLRDLHRDNTAVLADEEFFNDYPPMYFAQGPLFWVSPVYLTQLLCHAYKEVMRKTGREAGKVHGVFLTNTNLVNREDFEKIWDWLEVTVIDNANMHDGIVPADNGLDKEREMLEHFFLNSILATWVLDPQYDHVVEDLPSSSPMSYEDSDTADSDTDADEKEENADAFDGLAWVDELMTQALEEGRQKVLDDDSDDDSDDDDPSDENPMDMASLKGVEIIQPIKNPLEQLGQLVGLESIKKRIVNLSMLAKYNDVLREKGAKAHQISLHSIFYGNPGTGKSITGRIFASILHEMGILSKGHVVLANGRQAFVGSLFGEEETNIDKLLKLAQGGVLMIDEAYTLLTPHKDDPGRNVLPLLMKAMADENNRDFAVILTGYQEPINQLLELNPGLDSRFPEANRFLFPDFSLEELCKIARKKFEEYDYTLTPQAWARLKGIIEEEYANRNSHTFGNGRFVANLLEEIYQRHAVRCMNSHVTELSALQRFTASDIQKEKSNKRKMSRRTIGFTR